MTLPALIRVSGPFGVALAFLGIVIILLSVRCIFGSGRSEPVDLRHQANAILFWGAASMVLGFMGQCHSVYLALNAILAASEISPQIVAEGFVISFVPTLFGLSLLVLSSAVWIGLRALPGKGARSLPILLAALLLTGCQRPVREAPPNITSGVWTLDTGRSVFLWEFDSADDGWLSCLVHEFVGGLKHMETPCASVELDGMDLGLAMPNGVRYRGVVDLDGGSISGSLLYTDGTSREAPLVWLASSDFPDLLPRPGGAARFSYAPPRETDDGWEVSHALETGVDPGALEGAVAAILRGEAGFLKSVLVARGESLILEEYFHGYGPENLSPIRSCTKSVSSLLVGLAIDQGHIRSVDVPLLEFFPGQAAIAGNGWENLTLEDLLTMSMALDWTLEEVDGSNGAGPRAFREILARDVAGRPGRTFEYVNMNVNLLAGVLHQATGEHAEDFARRALFEPLEISRWDWSFGRADGFNLMSGSLQLRPRDMAKIGVMALNGGRWRGRSVVSEEWIRRSLSSVIDTGTEGEKYGYLWWVWETQDAQGQPLRVVFANGLGSQFIILFPELDLVVVTTGGNQENGKHLAVGEVIVRELLPGVSARPQAIRNRNRGRDESFLRPRETC